MDGSSFRTVCRQIERADLRSVARLLGEGFPDRPAAYWAQALETLRTREVPGVYPRYGFLVEHGDEPVGVILTVFAAMEEGGERWIRGNVSSWYVKPAFRNYATLLTSAALRFKEVSYLNVSPAPQTWPILEAQGYTRYSNGLIACLPALTRGGERARIRRYEPALGSLVGDPGIEQTLQDLAAHGATVLLCEASDGVHAFAFVQRDLRWAGRGAVQLAWQQNDGDFVRFAGALGRHLLGRGRWLVLLDGEGPEPRLVGRFFSNRTPKYFKGPRRPRLNDLAQTEAVLFGV